MCGHWQENCMTMVPVFDIDRMALIIVRLFQLDSTTIDDAVSIQDFLRHPCCLHLDTSRGK